MTHENPPSPVPEQCLSADGGGRDIPCLLDSPEALDVYLADVRRRREDRRDERRRAYWRDAVGRLGEELRAAEDECDADMVTELKAVIATFTDALAAAGPEAPDLAVAGPGTTDPSVSALAGFEPATSGPLAPESLRPAPPAQEAVAPPEQPHRNGTHGTQAASEGVAGEEAQRLAEEKARQALAARAEHLEGRIADHLRAGGGDLADALRARALLCEGQALARDPHAPKQGRQPLFDLLDDLAARTPWADAQTLGSAVLGPQAWETLSELYGECVVAGEAMEWYERNEQHLSEQSRIDLLNAISASQQRLYRRPDGIVRRDDTVQELYRRVREAGSRTAFIRALSPHVGDEELPALAGRCAPLLRDLRAEVEEARCQAGRARRREDAVAAVLAWEAALEGRGVTEESLETDRQTLCALLDECLAAGVPTSTVKVRAAILDTAPVLLEGQPKYARFLEAVALEREKRSLAAVEVAPPEVEVRDEELGRLVAAVVPFTRGKRVVMLGGKCRPQVAQELGGLLECQVTWPDSDRGDRFKKFETAVKKADVLLMLKNFASHESFYGSRDAMAAGGGNFVVIPSGYSVKQIVYQLSEYAAKSGQETVAA